MAKKNNTVEAIETVEAVETAQAPTLAFTFENTQTTATGRSIPGAQALNAAANRLASELVKSILSKPELNELANKVVAEGEFADAIELTQRIYSDEDIKVEELSYCTDEELSRLRESRRSDRCKTRKNGIGTAQQFIKFMSASIAEMSILQAMGKTYAGPSGTSGIELNIDNLAADQELLGRKIRSLQSKVSVLKRQGQFAPEDWIGWQQIENTKAQIAELQAHRVGATTRTTGTIKTPSMTDIKNALAGMSEEEKQALIAQLQKA